jgi:hypothetical protein
VRGDGKSSNIRKQEDIQRRNRSENLVTMNALGKRERSIDRK